MFTLLRSVSRSCLNVSAANAPKNGAFAISPKRGAKTLIDSIDLATGIEKRELLAKLAGNETPFDEIVIKRGLGLKDCPTEIPSAFDCRLVGCICDDEAAHISYMWLYEGMPKRCECGHWYKLVHKSPV